jgi:hypothetical protein
MARSLGALPQPRWLGHLGNAYAELRCFTEAADSHQQALAIYREAGDRHSEGLTLANLASAFRQLRQPLLYQGVDRVVLVALNGR